MQANQPLRAEMVWCSTYTLTFIARDESLLPQGAEGGGRVRRCKAQPCREGGHGCGSIEQFVEDPALIPAADA